jgi:hypothetical protein
MFLNQEQTGHAVMKISQEKKSTHRVGRRSGSFHFETLAAISRCPEKLLL